VRSYVNGIPHPERRHARGGIALGHRQGGAQLRRDARLAAQRRDADRRGHPRRGRRNPLQLRGGPRSFQGQTKGRLNNPRDHGAGGSGGAPGPGEMAQRHQDRGGAHRRAHHPGGAGRARGVAGGGAAGPRARPRSRTGSISPESSRTAPPPTPRRASLFIVEGDSAGGLGQAGPRPGAPRRSSPLRGKVLNAEQASVEKVGQNKELQDIVSALGDRDRRGLQAGQPALREDLPADGCGQRRAPHLDALAHLLLPAPAGADPERQRLHRPGRRSTRSRSARTPTGRWTTRIGARILKEHGKGKRQAQHHALQGAGRDDRGGAEVDHAGIRAGGWRCA